MGKVNESQPKKQFFNKKDKQKNRGTFNNVKVPLFFWKEIRANPRYPRHSRSNLT